MKSNIPYSILELATVSQGETPGDSFEKALDLAQKAETAGYHRFWLEKYCQLCYFGIDWSYS
jgi:hypothetical protein